MKKNLFIPLHSGPFFFVFCSLFLFLFSVFSPKKSCGQTIDWVWAKNAVSTSVSEGWSIAADKSDNVFITGYYGGTITFGAYSATTSTGIFLAKYDGGGNVKWVKSSLGGGGWGYGVTTDGSGNSFITGQFTASTSFSSNILSSMGSTDVFLVKYDPAGNVLWAKSAGGTGGDIGRGVATDASGNIYVTGTFSTPSFTIGPFTLTPVGTTGIFIAKYDAAGNVVWARSSGGAGLGTGYSMATDASANVFVSGYFGTTISFGSYTLTSAGGNDIFLAKYDSSGNVLWANRAGGTAAEMAYSVATDASGNACVTGSFTSPSVVFGSTTLTLTTAPDAFLVKYDPSGAVLWAKSIKGTTSEIGYSVGTDKNNKIYMTGSFTSPTTTFDTVTMIRPAGWIDPMFVAGYDSAGNALWAKALPSGGDDQSAVAVTPSGCVYIGGDIEQTIIVLAKDTMVSPTGSENAFVAKLCNMSMAAVFASSDTVFCSEPTKCIDFYDHSIGSPSAWQWYFPGAIPDTSTKQNPTNICYASPGTYPVTLVVTGAAGYDSVTVSPVITVGNIPPSPTITPVGNTLYSSHAAGYQWYFNGNPIPGATDSFYVANQPGTYSVRITDGNGCFSLSNGIISSSDDIGADAWVTIYPNPAKQSAVISWQSTINEAIELKVIDITGREIFTRQVRIANHGLRTEIDVSRLSDGIYLLKIVSGSSGTISKKLVVVH